MEFLVRVMCTQSLPSLARACWVYTPGHYGYQRLSTVHTQWGGYSSAHYG